MKQFQIAEVDSIAITQVVMPSAIADRNCRLGAACLMAASPWNRSYVYAGGTHELGFINIPSLVVIALSASLSIIYLRNLESSVGCTSSVPNTNDTCSTYPMIDRNRNQYSQIAHRRPPHFVVQSTSEGWVTADCDCGTGFRVCLGLPLVDLPSRRCLAARSALRSSSRPNTSFRTGSGQR